MSSESGPHRYQTSGVTEYPQGNHHDMKKAILTGLEGAHGHNNRGDKEREQQRMRESRREKRVLSLGLILVAAMTSCFISVCLRGGTKKSHPFPLPLHAMDTEHSANLSSTHRDIRANGSLSNSAAPMKHDSDISRGPRSCTIPARMAVPLCS